MQGLQGARSSGCGGVGPARRCGRGRGWSRPCPRSRRSPRPFPSSRFLRFASSTRDMFTPAIARAARQAPRVRPALSLPLQPQPANGALLIRPSRQQLTPPRLQFSRALATAVEAKPEQIKKFQVYRWVRSLSLTFPSPPARSPRSAASTCGGGLEGALRGVQGGFRSSVRAMGARPARRKRTTADDVACFSKLPVGRVCAG